MADERVFKVKIDGLEKSYKDTIRLLDVLNKIKDVHARVTVETNAQTQAMADSTNKTREKTKALTEEEKAEKKLEQTLTRRRQLDTQIGREQINANQSLRERTQQLQRSIQLENASSGSIDEKRLHLASLGRAYRALSDEERNAEHIGGAMLTQIQELRAEYNELERSLGNHAVMVGNYENATASLTGTLERLGEGTNETAENTKGMLSLFQAGVGIALMFDEGNDRLSKTMNNLGKIMAIVGALQQANNILLTKGALASKTSAVMEGVHAIQVRARASAIAMANKQTLLATVAQKAFNLVAYANPYVLLAMALISVVGALVLFSSNTETASEKQKRLNDLQRESIDLKNERANAIKRDGEQNIKLLEREYELMQAGGSTEAQLAMKRRHINKEREKDALKLFNLYGIEASHIEENKKKAEELNKSLEDINKAVSSRKGKFEVQINGKVEKLNTNDKEKIKEFKEAIEGELSNININIANGLDAVNTVDDIRHKMQVDEQNDQKKAFEAGKRSALALAEYKVLLASKGSEEELKAQIEVASQRLRNDISNAEITKGERIKRTQETLQLIEKLESDFRATQYKDNIALIDARLSLVKKGTLEEYNLEIAKLSELKKIDLENRDLTNNQRLQIENKYLADVDRLSKEYAKNLAITEIEIQTASINARLASVKAGTIEERNLRIELAKEEARLAKENIENTIENEELKSARIKEINEQLQANISEISSSSEVSSIEATASKETLALTKELEARTISKQAYERRMLAISISALQEEIKARRKYGQDTTDLEITLSQMRIDQAEKEKNKVSDYFEDLHTRMQETLGNIMEGVSSIFDAVNSVMQAQLDDANEKYEAISTRYDEVVAKREESYNRLEELEKEAQNAKGGRFLILQQQINDEMIANKQLADQEKNIAKEKEKQEKEIAKKEKQMKRAQILSDIAQGGVNTALAVTSALTVKPFPLGVVLASVAGAMGAVQIGVMSKQLSKLEDGGLLKGKRHVQGGMRVEGTNIEVEGGEYVVNRESTDKNLGLIRYINNQRRELKPSDINSFFSKSSQGFEPPFKRMFESGGQLPTIDSSVKIDNDSLVEAIQSIRIEPKVSVTDINTAQTGLVRVDNWTGL